MKKVRKKQQKAGCLGARKQEEEARKGMKSVRQENRKQEEQRKSVTRYCSRRQEVWKKVCQGRRN